MNLLSVDVDVDVDDNAGDGAAPADAALVVVAAPANRNWTARHAHHIRIIEAKLNSSFLSSLLFFFALCFLHVNRVTFFIFLTPSGARV